jgi:DnaJ like chaperone protein
MSNDAIETVLRGQRDGWLRRRVRWLARRLGVSRFVRARNPAGSPAFTTALVALAAKMAAADGVAVKSEAEAFERFLEVGPADRARLRRVYDLAKTDTAGFEVYASRINKLLMFEPETKRQVFDCLMYIACADGVVHPAEDAFLREVSTIFGYSEARFRRIRAMFVHDPESPYTILDVSPEASDAEIRAAYMKLVQRNHPDRLMANGAPAAVIKAATQKLAAINAAYEAIQGDKTRGRRAS